MSPHSCRIIVFPSGEPYAEKSFLHTNSMSRYDLLIALKLMYSLFYHHSDDCLETTVRTHVS